MNIKLGFASMLALSALMFVGTGRASEGNLGDLISNNSASIQAGALSAFVGRVVSHAWVGALKKSPDTALYAGLFTASLTMLACLGSMRKATLLGSAASTLFWGALSFTVVPAATAVSK